MYRIDFRTVIRKGSARFWHDQRIANAPERRWQKGTVENTNNRLRKYLPRSTGPTALTNRYLRSMFHRLNSTPRKCLGYRTPVEVFERELMAILNGIE